MVGGGFLTLTTAAAVWLYLDGADDRTRSKMRQEEQQLYDKYQQERQQQAYIEPREWWTLQDLAPYDGTNADVGGEDGPILLAADGLVFNVYKGRNFYGMLFQISMLCGFHYECSIVSFVFGEYGFWRCAAIAICIYMEPLTSIERNNKTLSNVGPGGEYHIFAGRDATRLLARTIVEEETPEDAAKPLNMGERAALAGWMFTIKNKYEVVGKLEGFDPNTTSMKSLGS